MTDTRPPTVQADRSTRKAGHRKKPSPALLVIPLVLVIAAVVLFLVLRGDDGGIPFVGDDGPTEAPPFDFEIRKVRPVATSEGADEAALADEAAAIERELTPVVDELYTNAFLDPANWRDGDYAEVLERFDDGARPTAEGSIETLTLGANAGDVYDEVAPDRGTLSYKVLFDGDGAVNQVVVEVRFTALGTRADGGYTQVVSEGTYFFDDPGTWLVSAFDVTRADREAQPPSPATSGSGSPSAPAS